MIRVRIVEKYLIITTTKTKPKKGDWMVCHAIGMVRHFGKDKGKTFGEKTYLKFHDDTPVSRLNAICSGTEKILFKFKFKRGE